MDMPVYLKIVIDFDLQKLGRFPFLILMDNYYIRKRKLLSHGTLEIMLSQEIIS